MLRRENTWRSTCGALLFSGVLVCAATLSAAPSRAQPATCDDPFCTPGIKPGVVLGSYCSDTTRYVFGTTSWGRLVFCGSPRRYEPRYFRSPPMAGVKAENSLCTDYPAYYVAQSPEGVLLTCVAVNGATRWLRGNSPVPSGVE